MLFSIELKSQATQLPEGYSCALWKYLADKYENNDLVNIGDIWFKYFSLKMEEKELFDQFKARVEEVKNRLTSVLNGLVQMINKQTY